MAAVDVTYVGSFTPYLWYQVAVVHPDGRRHQLDILPSLRVVNHSPSGFAWGYGGSGPAQLALALLLDQDAAPEEAALRHMDFKWQIVAKLDRAGFEMTGAEVRAWLCAERDLSTLRRDFK